MFSLKFLYLQASEIYELLQLKTATYPLSAGTMTELSFSGPEYKFPVACTDNETDIPGSTRFLYQLQL